MALSAMRLSGPALPRTYLYRSIPILPLTTLHSFDLLDNDKDGVLHYSDISNSTVPVDIGLPSDLCDRCPEVYNECISTGGQPDACTRYTNECNDYCSSDPNPTYATPISAKLRQRRQTSTSSTSFNSVDSNAGGSIVSPFTSTLAP